MRSCRPSFTARGTANARQPHYTDAPSAENLRFLYLLVNDPSDTALHSKPLAPDYVDAHSYDLPDDLLALALQLILG
jgi:hypothetical protein